MTDDLATQPQPSATAAACHDEGAPGVVQDQTEDLGKSSSHAASLQEAFKRFRVKRMKRKKDLENNSGVLSLPPTHPARKAFLRARFLELARSFIGVPYARRFHTPAEGKEECECEGCSESGRQLGQEALSLDCCGLVRKCIRMMAPELGFRLGPGNQAYQFDTLPLRVDSIFDLEPGDLIFYSGTYYNPDAKPYAFNMTHVEIFIGGDSGEATIGSRERQKWVKQYDSYAFEGKRWKLIRHHYVKIDTWLEGVCVPAHPELWQKKRSAAPSGQQQQDASQAGGGGRKASKARARTPGHLPSWNSSKYSLFVGGEQSSGEEAGDD